MAYGTLNYRRRAEIVVLAFMVLFAFASMDTAWIGWAAMASILAVLIVIDFMFLDDSAFIFEPDIKNYQRRTDPRY